MNNIKTILLALFVFISLISFSQEKLSEKAEILVLTLGPAQTELYSAFGHSAIRVYDPENNINRIYNYGVFDFDQPNFYLNFARGFLNYKLDTVDYPRFRYAYMYYNRFIHEQILNFNQEEKQQFYDFLEWNIQPENQYYFYDYFYDNCATRVRDAFEKVFHEKIEFDGSYVSTKYSIRDLTDLYLKEQPWGDLGIDLGLGLPMDVEASPYMYMFLPDYIESAFDHAYILRNGEKFPLVKQTIHTYESKPNAESSKSLFTPFNVFWSFFTLTVLISIYQFKKGNHLKGFDATLLIVVGFLGIFLFLLWVATDHKAAASNLNISWAWPTHFIAGIALMKRNRPKWLNIYFIVVGVFMALLVISWSFLPQNLHNSLIPISLSLGLRSIMLSKTSSIN